MNRIRVIFKPTETIMKLSTQNHLTFNATGEAKIFEMPNNESGREFADTLISLFITSVHNNTLHRSDFEFIEAPSK